MECAFVDMQGFVSNKKFHLKEICVLTKNTIFHDFVKPPFPKSQLNRKDKKQAEWLTNEYHGLEWDTGYITRQELINTIAPILKGKILLVKGLQKKQWMEDLMTNIVCINMEDIGCKLKLSEEVVWPKRFVCMKHKRPHWSHCARNNAVLMKTWFYTQSEYSHTVKSMNHSQDT